MEVTTAADTVTVTSMAPATDLSTAMIMGPRMLTTKATQRLPPMVARIPLLTGEHLCSVCKTVRVRHWMQAPIWGCALARASMLGSLLLFRAQAGESALADACRSSRDFVSSWQRPRCVRGRSPAWV